MAQSDREHFEEYRRQTEIKHKILTQYLDPYFRILLKNGHKRLVYIDGFAGPGEYSDEGTGIRVDGSPLRVLRLIAGDTEYRSAVKCVFIERDRTLFDRLVPLVDGVVAESELPNKPDMACGQFDVEIAPLVAMLGNKKLSLAPTFLFVDPCGVAGFSMRSLSTILSQPGCEAFVFFNLDGVRRILGVEVDVKESPTLLDLLGDELRVKDLRSKLRDIRDAARREAVLIDAYIKALAKDSGAIYFVPFVIEHEDRRTTSHVLLHASKHPIGFRIMKDIMWEAGKSADGGEGRLSLLQASDRDLTSMMRADLDAANAAILADLAKGPALAGRYIIDWAERAEDLISSRCYRRLLLQLEATGRILVFDKRNEGLAGKRRPNTLAPDYWLRLPD